MPELPHFIQLAPDGIYEFFLDHSMLSSARMCESRFILDYVENLEGKGQKPWPLHFGTLVHDSIEWYYRALLEDKYNLKDWLEFVSLKWREGNYDAYSQFPQFKAVGGFPGFLALITQYAEYYQKAGDNLKPIALEVPFGKAKEVPLLEDNTFYPWANFRLYLSGRLDFIFDDGRRIGPLDHKTFSMAGKNPMTTYEVQEGMTGYIYAMDYIYRNHFSSLGQRDTNILWLNFILTKSEGDLNKRFQRVPLYKTPWQLEQWRVRQISTAAKIYQMIIEGRPPDFNASVCTNYWHSVCPYQPIHRLGSEQDMFTILNKDFQKRERIWNPESE
jgi:PD-(D/E)XK nuclease superfamily